MSLTPLEEISCITPHSTDPSTEVKRESDTFGQLTGDYRELSCCHHIFSLGLDFQLLLEMPWIIGKNDAGMNSLVNL